MNKCNKCGNEIKPNAKFCPKCGAPTNYVATNNNTIPISNPKKDNTKTYIIIALIIIAIVAIAATLIITHPSQTSLKIITPNNLEEGSPFTVTLTDKNGNPVANQPITVNIIAANGESNIQNLITDNNGVATLTLSGLANGAYTFKCNFAGTFDYKSSSCDQAVTISNQQTTSSSSSSTTSTSSSSSSSSTSSGAVTVTGDTYIYNHLGHRTHVIYYSDGSTYYKDLVNNQALKVRADGSIQYY